MQRVARANGLLNNIASRTGMSQEGKQWLIAALDPMHDEKLSVTGYPDRTSGVSVCQLVKRSLTLSKPPGVATSNWNLAIVLDHQILSEPMINCEATANLLTQGIGTPQILTTGGLTWCGTADGAGDLSTTGNATDHGQLTIPLELTNGRFRVLSQGFEVVNTTADIQKQGAIAVWEQPSVKHDPTIYAIRQPGGTVLTHTTKFVDTAPPRTLAAALLLAGSQQWKAEEGCYCVATMNDLNNPARYVSFNGRVFTQNENDYPNGFTTASTIHNVYAFNHNNYVNFSGDVLESPPSYVSPFNIKGAYLTGLSAATTVTLNYNVWIETFPTDTNQLITLATPSACMDNVALQVYSEIICRMPVGVRFRDNDLGDFFKGVVDTIADVVMSVGKPLMGAAEGWQNARRGPPAVVVQQPVEVVPNRIPIITKSAPQVQSIPQSVPFSVVTKRPIKQRKRPVATQFVVLKEGPQVKPGEQRAGASFQLKGRKNRRPEQEYY